MIMITAKAIPTAKNNRFILSSNGTAAAPEPSAPPTGASGKTCPKLKKG